jgi:hypothetical protein
MSQVLSSGSGNSLLESLPTRQYNAVVEAGELVELQFGQIFCERHSALPHVCFPLSAFLSLVVGATGHPPLGTVLVGSEGMLGGTLLLGVDTAPLQAIVQGPGSAMLIKLPVFHNLLQEFPGLAPVLGRYMFSQFEQLARTVVCTRFHEVEARLVRWLLLTHDRAKADCFHLTHQFLADMLGVQRSAVTIAAGVLQQRDLISYSRGEITITNRRGLEALCCECYSLVAEEDGFLQSARLKGCR